jgi:hypothetical protein
MRKADPLDTWVLTFTRAPGHGDAPTPVRVRRLLKAALRCFGLKCVKVGGPPLEESEAPAPSKPQAG